MEDVKENVTPMKNPEIVDISNEAKSALMSLIIEESMKTPVVVNYIKGLSAGLGLKGNWMLRYEDFKFIKQE